MTFENAAAHVTLLSLLLTGCSGSEHTDSGRWNGTVTDSAGVTVVINPSTPLLGRVMLELEADLVIGDTLHEESFFFNRIDAGVDSAGRIHIWDPNSFRIQTFDGSGTFVRTVGKQGSGPGEFSSGFSMWYRVGEAGDLTVLESGKFQLFDPSGLYQRAIPARPSTGRFALLDTGLMVRDQFTVNEDGPIDELILTDSVGEHVSTIASYQSIKARAAMMDGLRFTHLAPEPVLGQVLPNGAAFGFPSEYRISLTGDDGEVATIIEVAEPPLELNGSMRDNLLEEMSTDVHGRTRRDLDGEVFFPDTWPYFDRIISDDAGNLLVQRVEISIEADSIRRLAFFDSEGLYLFEVLADVEEIHAVRSGYLYATRFNRELNVSQVIRYRILNWSVLSEAAEEQTLPEVEEH